MHIIYKTNKLKKECTKVHETEIRYGREMAEKIHLRLDQIMAADSIEEMIRCKIGRCHPLTGSRKNQYAVDLVHPFRLIFEKSDEGMRIVKIMEIIDYH